MDVDDSTLIAQFVRSASQQAFATLVERHISFGMERAAAEAWAGGPDQANAVLIEATRPAASRIIPWH